MRPQIPVTALALATIEETQDILVAGQGSEIRIYGLEQRQLLCVYQALNKVCVHGVEIKPGDSSKAECLVWGGRYLSIIEIHVHKQDDRLSATCHEVIADIEMNDWILHACFVPREVQQSSSSGYSPDVLAVTAHNELFSFYLDRRSTLNAKFDPRICLLAAGPLSILYSAHLAWIEHGRPYVAAGTTFGDVLLWTVDSYAMQETSPTPVSGILLRKFSGHEGSVFGVGICNTDSYSPLKLLLMSCSDDRTIRIWNTAGLFAGNNSTTTMGVSQQPGLTTGSPSTGIEDSQSWSCLASAMGHSSRIWSLRHFQNDQGNLRLLSFGEDATVSVWSLTQQSQSQPRNEKNSLVQLKLEVEIDLHEGKNIWAGEVYRTSAAASYCLLTGGSDGRISKYVVKLDTHLNKWAGSLPSNDLESLPADQRTPMRRVFDSMVGSWTMARSIISHLSTYPSGKFEGTAKLESRPPSDQAFDCEMLYHEEGEFKAEQGLTFRASRRYVYRYQASTNKITAWFTKPDEQNSVDHLFHQVDTEVESSSTSTAGNLSAEGYHLCVQDEYNAHYRFKLDDDHLKSWTLAYKVKGPKKDYVSTATYTSSPDSQRSIIKPEHSTSHDLPSKFDSVREGKEHFKSYCWISEDTILATVSNGRVFLGCLQSNGTTKPQDVPKYAVNVNWRCIAKIDSLRSYSTCTRVFAKKALLGGANGQVYLLDGDADTIVPVLKLDRKIASVLVQSSEQPSGDKLVVFTCLGSSCAFLVPITLQIFPLGSDVLKLELPPHFIVTSADLLGKVVILGSRSGALAFYDLSDTKTANFARNSLESHYVHGNDAVASIQAVPTAGEISGRRYFLTTGRDGTFAMHYLNADWTLRTVHKSKPPFGPNIEGATFEPESNSLVLWGFRGNSFVVWDHTQRIDRFKVDCKGCHRSWAYFHGHGPQAGGRLVWTQASLCHVYVQPQVSHSITQHGGHGRDVKGLAVRPTLRNNVLPMLIATGAEDTTIRLSKLETQSGTGDSILKCLSVMSEHTAGIQMLRWSSDGKYLLSIAGRKEFMIWHVQSVPYLEVGTVLAARAPKITELGELRIMALDILEADANDETTGSSMLIATVYSDSSLRVSEPLVVHVPS